MKRLDTNPGLNRQVAKSAKRNGERKTNTAEDEEEPKGSFKFLCSSFLGGLGALAV
jgi:hypothetical protein